MLCFNTSFLTFTLALDVFLDDFSQCCFASRANSDPSSATGSTSGRTLRGCGAALFFCLFAGGMAAGIVRGCRRCVASLYSSTRPFRYLRKFWSMLDTRYCHGPVQGASFSPASWVVTHVPHALRRSSDQVLEINGATTLQGTIQLW